MQQRQQVERTVCVAHRSMLSAGHLAALGAVDSGCVAGARLQSPPMDQQEKNLDFEA